jgi:CubicO group peptidase (beta-lactamase class C family)
VKILLDKPFSATAILLVIALMLAAVGAVPSAQAQQAPQAQQAFDSAAIDQIMADALKHFDCPGASIAIVKGGRLLYSRGYGVRSVDQPDPVTADTVFAIGSSTKAFTAAVIGTLVDEGKMYWDDAVSKHLPGFRLSDPVANQTVAIRDLLSHRTGLIRHDQLWLRTGWGRDELIRRIGVVPVTYPIRTRFEYQNIMFLAAGMAAGNAAGTSWEDLVQKRIFNPLGMTNATLTAAAAQTGKDRATPHIKKDNKNSVMPWRNIDNISPAGSINASANDLSKWMLLNLQMGTVDGKRILSPAAVREMQTPQMVVRLEGRWKIFFPESEVTQLSYGLGWFIASYRGLKVVGHGGTIDGFRAQIGLVPSTGIGVAVLANLNGTQLPESVVYQVIDQLMGLEKRDWNAKISDTAKQLQTDSEKAVEARMARRVPNTRPSLELSAYEGEYSDDGYGPLTISNSEGRLMLRWGKQSAALDHFNYDTFFTGRTGDIPMELVQFSLGSDGQVTSLTMFGTRFTRIRKNPRM